MKYWSPCSGVLYCSDEDYKYINTENVIILGNHNYEIGK